MAEKTRKADLYVADRMAGMTYAAIAKKYGVSRQAVNMACAKYTPGHFKEITNERCVYPYLRKWINENKVVTSEFIRRLGLLPVTRNYGRVYRYLSGKGYPTKPVIDKILAVTGLTYEQLFFRE